MQKDRVHDVDATDEITIWLVEDNIHFSRAISDLLGQSKGMRCPHAFMTAEDALLALQKESPPEVVFMDLGLPGMGGLAGIEAFRRISPGTEVVVLTVRDDRESVFEALCSGASGYLLKDAPPEEILEAVEEVIAGGVPMDGVIARKVLDLFSRIATKRKSYGLTEREKDVLHLMVEGMTKRGIADRLGVSFHTINTHLKNIYAKLEVNRRGEAVAKALQEKLI
jgi:DNA-binding NarL/FixJ family response regulator